MRHRYAARFVFCGVCLCTVMPFGEAHGRSPQKRNSGEAATSFGGKKDACNLLTGAEIKAVQGEPVSETKTSVQPNGEMLITECLYKAPQARPAAGNVLRRCGLRYRNHVPRVTALAVGIVGDRLADSSRLCSPPVHCTPTALRLTR